MCSFWYAINAVVVHAETISTINILDATLKCLQQQQQQQKRNRKEKEKEEQQRKPQWRNNENWNGL